LLFIYAVRWWWYVLYIVASSEKEIDAPFGFLVREFVYLFWFRMDGRRYSLRVNYTRVDFFSRIACTYISGIFGLGRGLFLRPLASPSSPPPLIAVNENLIDGRMDAPFLFMPSLGFSLLPPDREISQLKTV
jgi:hypothetical protein